MNACPLFSKGGKLGMRGGLRLCPGRSLRNLYRFSVTLRLPDRPRVERARRRGRRPLRLCLGSSLSHSYDALLRAGKIFRAGVKLPVAEFMLIAYWHKLQPHLTRVTETR